MHYISTRDTTHRVDPLDALSRGLAADGGLYVPESFPHFTPADFDTDSNFHAQASRLLQPFFGQNLNPERLDEILATAINFDLPVTGYDEHSRVLELFHGPTAAFKDVGARFLATTFNQTGHSQQTIIVATSGDTGGAVASAFADYPDSRVVILYPRGMVSARQEQQLTCWPDHVTSICIDGSFDDCQRLAKQALGDQELVSRLNLTSANSISIGRLLPQMTYYASTSLNVWRQTGNACSFVIPTGNLGNALAAIWARQLGLPIDRIVLATNANRTIPDFLDSGTWTPGETVATLASAMDVSNPSNMERLRHLMPSHDTIRQHVTAVSVSDEEIRGQIRQDYQRLGRIWCPHSASAAVAHQRLNSGDDNRHWVLVATAHAAKFETIVEPLIDTEVPVPDALARILELPGRKLEMPASWSVVREHLAQI